MKKGLFALALGTFTLGIAEFIIEGILTDVAHNMNVSIPQAGHLISIYALGVCAGAFSLILMHKYRPKNILLFLTSLVILGAIIATIAPSYGLLLCARFIQGLPHGAYFGTATIVAVKMAKEGKGTKAVAMKIDSHARSQSPAPSTDNHQQTIPDFKAPEEGKNVDKNSIRENIVNMMQLLKSRYDFRYNTVMKYVEYLPKDKGWYGYQPVDPRVQKRMTLEVQLADIRVSIKDVRNFLESDYIKNYNPIDEYLFQCYDKWDGKDHIRALARTVPTANPHWADWFYTWFLGMVDQWRGYSHRQYGNSVAPLLISKQGYNKSTFCRRLLPPELQWGYSDNLILSEKRQVYQAMAQFMVINLDEFNQISPQVQQGFLKNLIQLPTLKYKPPYGSHVMEFPRLASFIATSNMKDILSDPSGNRRFIGVELTGPIDVSVRPNYQQLFAQALSALNNGEKSYFDAQQVKLIMKSNSQFEVIQPIDQYFLLYFELVEDEKDGDYLTAAEIFDYLKKQIGSSLKVNSLMGFGRKLANMSELKHKRFADGMKYLVKKK